MATAFPANPTNGQLYTVGGYTYQWSSTKYTWTKVAQTTATIGNVSIVGNTISTTTGTSNTSITGNTITTGNTTSNTSITGNTVTITTTSGNTSLTGNTITTGNAASNTTITDTTVTTGNTTSNTTITGNTVTINTTTGNTTLTGNTITTGNATSNTTITDNTVTTGNTTSNTSITGNTVTINTTTGNTTITGNTITTGNATSNTTITDNTITIGNTTSNTSVTSNSIVTTTITGTDISVLGNIVGGNLLTVGVVSATSNITGGNINTGGSISAVGNIWGGGVRSTASATEPTNPGQGDIWYNTSTDVVYRYTYDGTSYYWIDYYGSTLGQNANIVAVNNGSSSVAIPVISSNINFTVNGSVVGSFTSAGLSVGNIVNSNSSNAVGNIGSATNYFNTIFSAQYTGVHADLAEHYQSDQNYSPGTVVVFGGDKEITISGISHDTRVAGVVSKKPAFIMNNQNPGVLVALIGKVQAYVMGPVSKGDRLVNIAGGVAGRINPGIAQLGCVLGKSLEDHPVEGQVKLVEIAVGKT